MVERRVGGALDFRNFQQWIGMDGMEMDVTYSTPRRAPLPR